MKRILFIDHPQFTSATYYLWQGLKELEPLLQDHFSVSCYPFLLSHFDTDEYDLGAMEWFNTLTKQLETEPLPYGIPAFQKGETLTTNGNRVMVRGGNFRRFPRLSILENEERAISELKDGKYDLIILGNGHRVPTILLGRLKERVPKLPPIIYYDAGERDELNEHWIHVFKPDLVFKQILTPAVKAKGLSVQIPGYTLKMYPLPLSSPHVGYPSAQVCGMSIQALRRRPQDHVKALQVFYALGHTWPERQLALKALDEISEKASIMKVKVCSYLDYHMIMALSCMAVTMRGSGRDTNHYWDIPLYRTAMVCDGTMGCIHPYPFEDMKTAFFYRSIDQLSQIVRDHLPLQGPAAEERDRIALAGQKHLEKYHSTTSRAAFFLDIVNQELNFFDREMADSLHRWQGEMGWDGRPWEGPVV